LVKSFFFLFSAPHHVPEVVGAAAQESHIIVRHHFQHFAWVKRFKPQAIPSEILNGIQTACSAVCGRPTVNSYMKQTSSTLFENRNNSYQSANNEH